MNPEWEKELQVLRAVQADLRRRLDGLEGQIARLNQDVSSESVALPVPENEPSRGKSLPVLPPPLPRVRPLPEPRPASSVMEQPRPQTETTPAVPPENLELKVGQYWLVRVGILVLLTGLVLLGNLAYHTFVVKLGAPGKLALLYLAGGVLGLVGLWLERRTKTTRNYGRVLLAGGVATVYYATYAAHFVEPLRIIANPWMGGLLLLGLAGGLTWLAERRRSQGVALVAVLLSYYTAAINPAANFTLFSNLVLTGVAVFLLLRHRWLKISWLSLAGSYGAFAYWSAQAGGGWPVVATEPFWPAQGFLCAYWGIFTLAVFLHKTGTFSAGHRVVFLTANNVLFFVLSAPAFATWHRGEFWIFALFFGGTLLGLSVWARRLTERESEFDGAWLAQGLMVVAVGLAARFTGYQLAGVLVLFSTALVFTSGYRQRILLEVAAGLAGAGAFFLALGEVTGPSGTGWITGLVVASFLFLNGWLLKRARGSLDASCWRWEWGTAGFVLLAMVLAGAVLEDRFQGPLLAWAFSIGAVGFTVSRRILRLPEVIPLAQGFLVAAGLTVAAAGFQGGLVWSLELPVLAAALLLMHWWQRQEIFAGSWGRVLEGWDALVFCAILLLALSCHDPQPSGMVVMAGIGLTGLLYGLWTRAWFLAGFSQMFSTLGAVLCVLALLGGDSDGRLTLGTFAVIVGQAAIIGRIPEPGRRLLGPFPEGYRVGVFCLGGLWVVQTVPSGQQFLVLTLVGGALVLWSARKLRTEGVVYGCLSVGLGFAVFVLRTLWGETVSGSDSLALLGVLGLQQAGKAQLASVGGFSLRRQSLVAAAALAGLWVQVTRWTWGGEAGVAVTVVWAGLAFAALTAGFLLRERTWRLMGLLILGVAVGHVFLVDVWKMGQFVGILGIIALAVVLLVLGFIYNRFAGDIKKWL